MSCYIWQCGGATTTCSGPGCHNYSYCEDVVATTPPLQGPPPQQQGPTPTEMLPASPPSSSSPIPFTPFPVKVAPQTLLPSQRVQEERLACVIIISFLIDIYFSVCSVSCTSLERTCEQVDCIFFRITYLENMF